MLTQIQRKTLVKSALSFALLLKVSNLIALPAIARNSDNLGIQAQDLAALSSAPLAANQLTQGQCPPLSSQVNLPTQIASAEPNLIFAQTSTPTSPSGGSCPADFTSIPCGTGSELFCEVGGLTDGPVGGGLLAPLALAGSGFPFGALAPLAAAPLAFLGGDDGGGGATSGGGTTTPQPDPEPIPEPSMVPAAALALGFIYFNRRRRKTHDLSVK